MISDNQLTKKSKFETNLRSDSRPYLDGPIYNGSTYEGPAKCFSPQSLLGLEKLLNKCVTNQFRIALAKGQMSPSFVSIIKLTMRMAAVHEATVSAVHKVTLFLVYKITLFTVRIKLMKVVTSLQVNIKPTRTTNSISRAHQVYRIFQDHQEAAAYLTA